MDHLPAWQARIPVLARLQSALPSETDAFVSRFVVEPTHAGPLSGTTFAVKDLFDVAGRPTGCGNPSWLATHPPATRHAAVIERLLAAGARLTGKTRTDEMAYSLDGRNHHEGAPLNPAAPSRLTGGSSSGSAAAVAGGEVDFALGTDTAGSVRVPAAWCGLLGLRPTHARITVAGLTPLAASFDTVGWFARSGLLLRAVGRELLDGSVVAAPAAAAGLTCVRAVELDHAGGAVTYLGLPPPKQAAAVRLAELLPVTRDIHLGLDLKVAVECLRTLQAREAWIAHGAWVLRHAPTFGAGVAERFDAARAVTNAEVRDALRTRAEIIARLDAVLPPGTVLSLPCVPGPAALRDASAEQLAAQRTALLPLTVLASLSGRPQLCLPLRLTAGAPVGIGLLGWRGGDEMLLDLAALVLP